MCQNVFCFFYDIGLYTLCSLRKHIDEVGPCTRQHGSKGQKAHNAYLLEVISAAVEFIKNYSSVFGLPQPATARGRANQAPTYLPTSENHKIVHAIYQAACMQEEKPFMQYRSFLDMWHQCIPHVVFMTPRTDVCHFCEDYRITIQRAIGKKGLLAEFTKYLEEAQKEHDFYLAAIEKLKLALAASNAQPAFAHVTFDFAQQAFSHTILGRSVHFITKYQCVYRSLALVMTLFLLKSTTSMMKSNPLV